MQILTDLPPSRSPRGGEANQRALVQTEAWLLDQLRALGYEPQVLPIEFDDGPTYEGAPDRWHNIIIEIPARTNPSRPEPTDGSDADPDTERPSHTDPTPAPEPAHPTPVLVLSAHFDSVQGSPGADDDGTGTAALLEIARILRDHQADLALNATIRLCFFNLEETGLVGSRDYCARILRPRLDSDQERVVGMVSLEMLGYFTDEPNSQGSPVRQLPDGSPMPTVGNFIAVAGLAAHQGFSGPWSEAMQAASPDLPVLRADFFPIPIPDILRSDHAPFLALQVPAVMLTDTANFRNPNYHRASDSIATIDRDRFTLVVRAVLGAALELATNPPPLDP